MSADNHIQNEALNRAAARHDEIARWIEERGVSAPAIFLLEFLKPLTGCLRELFVASEPVSALVVSPAWRGRIRELLSSSEDIEKLICTLERGIEPQGRLQNRT